MTKPLRLLELATNFRPGGIQRHVLDLTEDLRGLGHQVTLAGDGGDWSDANQIRIPLNTVSAHGGALLKRVSAIWPCVRGLRRAIKADGIQLVHAHETAPAIVARLATLGLNVPVVMTFHGSAPSREVSVARTARWCADMTISPSRDGIDRLVSHGLKPEKGRAMGLGVSPMPDVPPETASALRAQLLDGREGPLILSLSRLDVQKGIDVMVDVAARVTAQLPGATFVVAGKGKEDHAVHRWAQEAGVTDAMKFIGSITNVGEHLAASDLFLLTSRWENLPISIVESFRAGVPVIATDCGGVRELVDDHVGALVPVEDAAASAQAILRHLCDPDLLAQAGANALVRSHEDRFTPSKIHENYAALYQEVLDRQS